MAAEKPPSSPAVLPLALLVLLGAWLALFEVIGNYTWKYGRRTFLMLTLVLALLAFAKRIGAWLTGLGGVKLLKGTLGVALLVLLTQLGLGLKEELQRPKNERWAIDIAANTYLAGSAFLRDENPYEARAQTWHRIQPGPNVTVEGREVRMYGKRYTYGFPYFPAMFLSYLPGRAFSDSYHALRIENALLLLLNLGGVFWLARRLSRGEYRTAIGLAACVAYVGSSVLQEELFRFAITDLVIATYAIFAFVALSHGQVVLAGVLFGAAQACKLLPGPLLVLPALLWMFGKPGFWKLAAAYVGASLALIVPFVLPDPELFLSSTILFYLTYHAVGDDTSLWFFLPDLLKVPFRVIGYALTLACVALCFWRRDDDVLTPLTCAFAAYIVFIAFNNMTHLNYIWGVYTLGCAALAVRSGRSLGAG